MQLASLTLRNFQAHKRLELVLSPGITTIKGPSDAGKSAILRALRWACLNDFSGEDFIREGAEGVLVTVSTKEGNTIERGKGKPDGNVYRLDKEELKAFGQGVPEPVQKALKLSELNFQSQHDAPFWFSLSGPEVSRQLNAIIDLSVIDTTLSNVANLVRTARERVNISKERILELERSLAELEPQRARIKDFEHLQEWSVRLDKRTRRHERLQRLLNSIEEIDVEALQARHSAAQELQTKADALQEQEERIERLFETLDDVFSYSQQAEPPPDFSPLQVLGDVAQKWEARVSVLSELLRRIASASLAADALAEAFRKAESTFHKNIVGVACPVCGQPLPKPHTI